MENTTENCPLQDEATPPFIYLPTQVPQVVPELVTFHLRFSSLP
jgi:hypothetical protein